MVPTSFKDSNGFIDLAWSELEPWAVHDLPMDQERCPRDEMPQMTYENQSISKDLELRGADRELFRGVGIVIHLHI